MSTVILLIIPEAALGLIMLFIAQAWLLLSPGRQQRVDHPPPLQLSFTQQVEVDLVRIVPDKFNFYSLLLFWSMLDFECGSSFAGS